jgi:hypothetical protein
MLLPGLFKSSSWWSSIYMTSLSDPGKGFAKGFY